jgi:hypothetical protein
VAKRKAKRGAFTSTALQPEPASTTGGQNRKNVPYLTLAGLSAAIPLLAIVGYVTWKVAFGEAAPGDQDKLIDKYVQARQSDPENAAKMVNTGKTPVGPVTEEEASRLQAGMFLNSPDLIIGKVLPGIPDGEGSQKKAAGYFTLVTEGSVSSSTLQVKTANGISNEQRHMTNPDLIVQIRDGKINPVRAELHAEISTLKDPDAFLQARRDKRQRR